MPDLLVSKAIEGIIDRSQFGDEDVTAHKQEDAMPFYATLHAGEHEYVGWLVHIEEEDIGKPSPTSRHRRGVCVRVICRAEDVSGLIAHRYEIDTIRVMNNRDEVAKYDVSGLHVKKFGICQDNPLDSTIYAAYISFE